ncbi:MAG: TIGR00159 family protein [Leptospiraceae bacterium]|nr:diadenylate cyclase CdaA [Leptospiraceae bacterium]MCP5513468.1 TIGR00159 family protein [Leptospiraceae bacterium]
MDYLKSLTYLDFYNISIFRALIDIFIVTIIIYTFYLTIRNTRGVQLLLGIVLILVLGSLSNYFELELLDWIIASIRPALVFLVIVLLQPELRRVFSDITKSNIVNLFLIKPIYELDEIVDAVKTMAASRTGSIIAISKDISLRDIIERSVQLDAIISSSLLLTIFKKNSALHDGAVIVEQNRIASASSYLPMSDKLGTSTMGARHRSALGLAEETDAVVIITSEETGEISVCYNGEMLHPIKPFELKTLVLQILESKPGDSQPNVEDVTKSAPTPPVSKKDRHKEKETEKSKEKLKEKDSDKETEKEKPKDRSKEKDQEKESEKEKPKEKSKDKDQEKDPEKDKGSTHS